MLGSHAEGPVGAHHAGEAERLVEVLHDDGGAPAVGHEVLDACAFVVEVLAFAQGDGEIVDNAFVVSHFALPNRFDMSSQDDVCR